MTEIVVAALIVFMLANITQSVVYVVDYFKRDQGQVNQEMLDNQAAMVAAQRRMAEAQQALSMPHPIIQDFSRHMKSDHGYIGELKSVTEASYVHTELHKSNVGHRQS